MKFRVFWDTMPCSQIQVASLIRAQIMDAASTSETSVNIDLTTRRYIPEDSELHTRRHENLKSHIGIQMFQCPNVSIEIRLQ
jgi:Arc/MetJ family transcription regulator